MATTTKDFPLLNPQISKEKKRFIRKKETLKSKATLLGRGHIASQYPSKKAMMCVDGAYNSLDSSSNASSHFNTSSNDFSSGEEELYPIVSDFLIARRLLGSHPKDDDVSQR
jgi:hypothetical protein